MPIIHPADYQAGMVSGQTGVLPGPLDSMIIQVLGIVPYYYEGDGKFKKEIHVVCSKGTSKNKY